jgi:hypothetical protein
MHDTLQSILVVQTVPNHTSILVVGRESKRRGTTKSNRVRKQSSGRDEV